MLIEEHHFDLATVAGELIKVETAQVWIVVNVVRLVGAERLNSNARMKREVERKSPGKPCIPPPLLTGGSRRPLTFISAGGDARRLASFPAVAR